MLLKEDLTWYLSEGIAVFERSTIGAILDKLELESCTSRACRTCHGTAFVNEPHKCPDPKDPARTITVQFGAWCPKCKGTGVEPVFLSAEEQKLVDSGEWMNEAERGGQRSAVPDQVLVRYAYISRLLSALCGEDRDAVELAYGDEGEELSHGVKGRVWAVLPLTRAGKELLAGERDRKEASGIVAPERPVQCLVSLADLPKSKRTPKRTVLLAEALEEAARRLSKAEEAWDALAVEIEVIK